MPRSGKLDTLGVLRHVMGREIERKYNLKKWALPPLYILYRFILLIFCAPTACMPVLSGIR
jgi:hypothetical protein